MSKKDKVPDLSMVPRPKHRYDDPLEVIELLKKAILRQDVDQEAVSEALRQVLHQYEAQNRVFMIAAANAELPRVVRLLTFLQECEEEMFTEKRVKNASTRELSRMYALAQSNLLSSLDNIKRVADMRLDAIRARGAAGSVFSEDAELDTLSDLPGLDGHGRDRVRKLVGGLLSAMEKDDSVSDNEDDEDE